MDDVYSVVKTLVLPPASLLILAALGWLIARKWRTFGHGLTVLALLVLLALSVPLVSATLLASLQHWAPLPAQGTLPKAQAVVILGGDLDSMAPEYGGETAGPLTIERLRYGAALSRRTGVPVLVAGGKSKRAQRSMAEIMSKVLIWDFGLTPRWREDRSENTRENAQFAAEILESEGIESIYLVTHAWHMPRAVASFRGSGLTIVPAGMGYVGWDYRPAESARLQFGDFVPSAHALAESTFALYEILGALWYQIRPDQSHIS